MHIISPKKHQYIERKIFENNYICSLLKESEADFIWDMREFKIWAVALMVLLGFASCGKDNIDEVNNGEDYDYSADLVGTWTCLHRDYAEALIINADGTAMSFGVHEGEYWENIAGNIVVKDGKFIMTFEDDDNFEGQFVIIPGEVFSVYTEDSERYVYRYCANDLSRDILGMWVCNNTSYGNNSEISVVSYHNDGTRTYTGILPHSEGYAVNATSPYYLVGDLMFAKNIDNEQRDGPDNYIASRLIYTPNGTALGDIMTYRYFVSTENDVIETSASYLRVKESLDLAERKYDYSNVYVSNVKGEDRDIYFMGYLFNFSKMDGALLDKMLRNFVFNVEFPDANTIKYNFTHDGQSIVMDAPIKVDGNKVTVKMSERNAAFKDVDLYVFQDAASSQLHMYMYTKAVINFFGNMKNTMLAQTGKLDLTDAAAVEEEYNKVDEVIDSINMSIVVKTSKQGK